MKYTRQNRSLQAAGERGSFWTTRAEAEAATNGVVPIVEVKNELSGLGKIGR